MKTLAFSNGDAVPQFGLGTWLSKPNEVYDAVIEAVKAGYRHIDCAYIYKNEKEIGTWTSPGDYGDVRGKLTPDWWKLAGSQYGLLKNWSVVDDGSYVDGTKVSNITLNEVDVRGHSSVKVRIGIKDNAVNVGGINIFGRGFGNYDQDIVMKMHLR